MLQQIQGIDRNISLYSTNGPTVVGAV